MKQLLLIAGIFLSFVFTTPAYSQQDASHNEKAAFVAALNMLSDDDYKTLESYQKLTGLAAVIFLTDDQLSSLSKDKASIQKMKHSAMFSLGKPGVLPIYVRKQSSFYESIISSFSRQGSTPAENNLAVMALAAKISHEIYHVRNPIDQFAEEDEQAAIEHEKGIFKALLQKNAVALNLANMQELANRYLDLFDRDLAIAKNQK